MAIHYHCRHCGTNLGVLDRFSVHSEQIGLSILSSQERQEMVSYQPDGSIYIKAICEDCQEALERNPQFHEQDYLIQ